MGKKQFPSALKSGDPGPQPIGLENIEHYLELSQLGVPEQGKVWLHSDPISRRVKEINDKVRFDFLNFKVYQFYKNCSWLQRGYSVMVMCGGDL